MAFTEEDKKELSQLIAEALDTERDRRRARFVAEQKENPVRMNSKLVLVTLPYGQRMAFPDEKGRAILNDVAYVRVQVKEGEELKPFYEARVEVVAWGDGKLLAKSFFALLPGSCALTEVEEGFLESLV
jgi:hypothetical protein